MRSITGCSIDSGLRGRAAGSALGLLVAHGLSMGAAEAHLAGLREEVGAQTRERFGSTSPAEDPRVQAMRRFFKSLGVDPSRYRPSSEALLRRVLGGKGLPAVNGPVDVSNCVSLLSRLPIGIYDLDRIRGALVFRMGCGGEHYTTLSGDETRAEGKPVLSDAEKVLGGPIVDSLETAVRPTTRSVLQVTFAPPELGEPELREVVEASSSWLIRYCGAQVEGYERVC